MEILNRKVDEHSPCHKCPVREPCRNKLLRTIEASAVVQIPERWVNQDTDRTFTAFAPGETVIISMQSDPGVIYCGSATHSKHGESFISLRNFTNFKEVQRGKA